MNFFDDFQGAFLASEMKRGYLRVSPNNHGDFGICIEKDIHHAFAAFQNSNIKGSGTERRYP